MPLGMLDRIKESIVFNAPGIASAASSLSGLLDSDVLGQVLSRLKLPAIAALGVAFVSGLAYLAYKLYNRYTTSGADEAVEKIMADLSNTAPDLMKVEGWYDKILGEVIDAVESSNDPSVLVEKIAAIKTAVIEHQKTISPERIGSGISLFAGRKKGGGLRVAW
jgi:hypothetical protein